MSKATMPLLRFVQSLRYKDYQLVARPALIEDASRPKLEYGKLFEVATVRDFSSHMTERGVLPWWRKAMGYQ
jgi:hypothetical protein